MRACLLGLLGWVCPVAKDMCSTTKPEGQASGAVPCSMGLDLLRLTVMRITNSSVHNGPPVRTTPPSCNSYCQEWDESNWHLGPHHKIAMLIPAQHLCSFHSWQTDQGGELAHLTGLLRLWAKVNFSLTKLMFLGCLWGGGFFKRAAWSRRILLSLTCLPK